MEPSQMCSLMKIVCKAQEVKAAESCDKLIEGPV